MTSINTNAAATVALRTLQATSKGLEMTQSRISTGLKINEAKDNAAYWSIATTLKSDNKSLSTVKDALGLGAATVDTAYQGLNKAKEVLDEIKSKLTAATQDGVDRSKIQAEITQLQKQLASIATSSSFSGENWLSVDSSVATYNKDKTVVSSFSRDATGAVSIGTIGVDITGVKLFDANANAAAIVNGKTTLKNASGVAMTVGGFDAATAPATTALAFSGTATGSAGNAASGAVVSLGNLDMSAVTAGDKIAFNLTVDGTSNTVRLDTTGLSASDFASKLQTAINGAVGAGKATVKVGGLTNGTTGAVTIEAAASTGTGSTITVGTIGVVDGDGTVTATAGLLTAGSLPAPKFGTAYEASASMQGAGAAAYAAPANEAGAAGAAGAATPVGTVTQDAGAAGTLTFSVTYNGVTKSVTTASITNSATAGTQATNVAAAMQTAINTAFTGEKSAQNGRLYVANDIAVSASGANIQIATAKKGSLESVQVGTITSTQAGMIGATTTTAGRTVAGTGQGAGIVAGDTFSMNVQYGSTVKQITHTFAAADFAGAGLAAGWATAGQPTAAEWEGFLQSKIDTAFGSTQFNGTGATYVAGDIDVKQAAGVFSVETRKMGADMSVGISNVQASIYGDASVAGAAGKRLGLAENSTSNYYVGSTKTAGTGVVGYGAATAPTQTIGTFDNAGVKTSDRISLTVNVGGTEKTVTVSTDGMTGVNADRLTDAALFKTRVQNALDQSVTGFGGNVVTFDVDTAGGSPTYAMTLKTTAKGPTAYLAISNVTAQDGNGVNSSIAGLSAGVGNVGTTRSGQNVASSATAVLASGTAFTGPQTIGLNDSISFSVSIDATAKSVTIDRARVDAALGGAANGLIGNGTDYAAVLNSAFTAAGVAATATAPGNVLTLTRNGGPGAGTVQVTGVSASGGADTMSVDKIDLTDAALSGMGVTSANRKDVLNAYISLVNDAISKVTTAAAGLGSVSKRIDLQTSFVDTLMDTIDKGVGNLVDADVSEESTKLQALQVKQQLGVQALSIANQSSQNILRLFQ